MTAFEDASRRRDDIAHGIATAIKIDNKSYGAFLFPPSYNTQRTYPYFINAPGVRAYMAEKFRYTAEDIRGFRLKFSELTEKTVKYVPKIKKIERVPAMLWGAALKSQGQSDDAIADFCKRNGLTLEDLYP